MKFNKTLVAAVIGVLAFIGIAISQTISVPQVTVLNPTDLFQVVPLGQPSAANVYSTPSLITSQFGYQKYGATVSGTYTFQANQGYIVLHNGTTVSSVTIVLAAAPSDGARQCVFSTDIVTTLVVAANTGQSINNAVTSLSANTGACYLFSKSNLTWDRS